MGNPVRPPSDDATDADVVPSSAPADPGGAPVDAAPRVGTHETIAALLVKVDEIRKAAPARREPGVVREQLARLLADARQRLPDVANETRRLDLAAAIARRVADLDRDQVATMLGPSPKVAAAPTRVDDPVRVPPGQHLTAGFPVLHVGAPPDWSRADVRVVVTGQVASRLVLDADDLDTFEHVEVVADFHCVTSWSRLDNRWTGVRARDVLERAGVRSGVTHVIAAGAPAYSATMPIEYLLDDATLLAWAHDGKPLAQVHGGPLRLVVPALYGWKSVKWLTELRLTSRPVRGYWEERGYHDLGDPFRAQRFRGDR